MTIEQMAMELLGLSSKERALLAEKLLASLDTDSASDVTALWAELAEKRAEEIEEGKVDPRDAEDVLRDAESKLTK